MKRFLFVLLLALQLACGQLFAAVPVVTPEVEYTSAGTKDYSFAFRIFSAGDLVVTVDGLAKTLGTHYTVSGENDPSGGTVSFFTAPASGASVKIVRATPLNRTTDYTSSGPLRATTLNADLDRIVTQIQDAGNTRNNDREIIDRALKFPEGEAANPLLPPVLERANKAFGFDAGGNPAAFSVVDDLSGYAVSSVSLAGALVQYGPSGHVFAANLTHRVETIEVLKLLDNTADRKSVFVEGRLSVGDGYAGNFHWLSGNQTEKVLSDPRHGIYVPGSGDPTGGSGAWERIRTSRTIDARWFGVACDGITDDSDALRGWAAMARSGDELYLHDSGNACILNNQTFGDAIKIDADNVMLRLAGTIEATGDANGVDAPMAIYVTGNDFTMIGGTIRGSGTVVTNEMVVLNCPGLVRIDGDRPTVLGVKFVKYPEIALLVRDANAATIEFNEFEGYAQNNINPQYYAIIVNGTTTYGHKIRHNRFVNYDSTHGNVNCILLTGSNHYDCDISFNYAQNAYDHLLYANLVNSVISGNIGYCLNSGSVIKLNSGSGNSLVHNKLTGHGGMSLIDQSDTITANNDVNITGNSIGIDYYNNNGNLVSANNNYNYNNNITCDIGGAPAVVPLSAYRFSPSAQSENFTIDGGSVMNCGYSDAYRGVVDMSNNVVKTDVVVKNLSIRGSVNQNTIYCYNAQNVKIQNVDIKISMAPANARAIRISNTTGATLKGLDIDDLQDTPTLQYGLYADSSVEYDVIDNKILNASFPWSTVGIGEHRGNRCSTDPLSGTFTLNAAASTTVDNKNVYDTVVSSAITQIEYTPINTSAALLMGSSKRIFVTGKNQKTSFTVRTADNTSAAGTEQFFYRVIQ